MKRYTNGLYTFAYISIGLGIGRSKAWAIVTNYRSPNEYDKIVCSFEDSMEPSDHEVTIMVDALTIMYLTRPPKCGAYIEEPQI